MKKIFIKKALFFSVFLVLTAATVFSLPTPKGYVSDYAGIISRDDAAVISEVSKAVKEKTGAEIAVLTVNSISPYGSIEEYSNEVASEWGIGEKGKDNGVLIVLSKGERQVRIEVGYGLEGAITDGISGEILDRYMMPLLKKGDYSGGLKNGALAAASVVADEYNVKIDESVLNKIQRPSASYSRRPVRRGISIFDIIIFLFIFLGGGRFFLPIFLLSGFGRRGYYGGGFGSSSGGGFSGGGFSGFGGGGFGGGGASRGF